MATNVGEDCGIEQRWLFGAAGDLCAQLGSADVILQVGQDGQSRFVCCGVGEAISIGPVIDSVDGDAGREHGWQIAEAFSGPGGDDEVGVEEQLCGAVPLVERSEGVSAE